MTDLVQVISALSPRKRALLVARNPLSFAQQRLWLFDQMAPGSPAYNVASALRLAGTLDIAALRRTLHEIVRRHEVLRTTFLAPDGEPMQVVHPDLEMPVPVIDLQRLGEEERGAEVRRLLAAEARRPFDLATGPLVRCGLLRLALQEHVFFATLHHIVADGWSVEVLTRELVTLYGAFSAGRPSPLPELPIQYLDFARWQREWLTGEVLDEQLAFWKRQLAGAPPTLDLPTDHPVPRVRSFRSGRRSLLLPAALDDGLRRLGQRCEATLFMTVLAAFMALLSRLTGQTDLVVGSPVANRTRAEVEPLIGFFLNMLALRGDLAGDPSVLDLLVRVREVVLAAQSHQDLPFERLIEELQPERTLNRAPVVQSVFVWLIAAERRLELPGLELTPAEVEVGASQYDLTLSVLAAAEGFAAKLEYSADLFDDSTIRRFLSHFATLLSGLAEEPHQRLSELHLLAPEERRQLLADWTTRGAAEPEDRLIHELLAARAAVAGDAEAVVCGDERLTYRELERRAGCLAAYLRRLGVEPETLVVLCVERSVDTLVGVWGILEAGGAYVPLDPFHPPERRAWILADSRAPVVVTQARLAQELPAPAARIVCLDTDWPAIATALDDESPARRSDPDNLAYVSYTSGSTGRPKGVQITHRSVVNFLCDMEVRLGVDSGDTLLAVTTLAFDISVLELVLPLIAGARVAVVGPEVTADGGLLAASLASHGATLIQATPATFQLLLQSGWRGHRGLRILCGGEAMPPELASELLQCGAEVWNLYGPTETTIWSAAHRVAPGPGPVPIGRPIANTSLRVLGRDLELQPPGVPGELHIGGSGLSRGYANRPELTAERFIPDAWSGEAGARIYKTGDLARVRLGDTLEFLGRSDHQVKLRGFRIELGEIEAVLKEHAGVREAVVVLRQDRPGNPRLAAYVVAADAPPLAAALREHLHEKLPAYMVPAAIVFLEHLPLTPNGKLDRRALPAPDLAGAGREPVAPRTPLEEQLAGIWAELLGYQRVGVEASFFELGGHSLIAARMMHRLRRELAIDLPLAQLFETPTIAGLAAAVARCKADLAAHGADLYSLPPIVPDPASRYEPFPLNEVQQAYWIGRGSLFALGNVASHNYTEMDVSDLDVERLNLALRRLIARTDMLRAIVLPDGRQQILREVPPYEVQVLDLRGETAAAAAVALAAIRETMSHQVLPADRWPLFEVRASLLAEQRTRLHWSLDYLIADAWSMGLIFREVFALYDDPELVLPALTLSFRDCVMAEQRLAGTEIYRRAEAYWKGRLPALPPAPELPLAKDPRLLEKPRFVRRRAELEPADWNRLKAHGAGAGLTPSGVLLAAFCEVLGVWSKNPRFTLNVTLFNRPPLHPEINEIVGDFTSLSLLAVDTSIAGPFALRARAVQEQLWCDMEHQAMGGVQVLRELARTRGASPDAVMPIVFTSALGQDPGGGERASRNQGRDSQVYGISQTPQVWLDHQVIERGGALIFNWDAVEEIFPRGLLDDLFAAYCLLLATLVHTEDWRRVARPELPPAQLAARQAVNATAGTTIPEERLQTLFSNRAAQHSDRPAVIAPDRTLTYGELERRASQLALRLREIGVTTNELVAVVMEKGWQQVVAVLAILKSGAAYLPIDPDLPRQRMHHLLERGQARAALTQSWLERELEWPPGIERLCVEDEPPADLPVSPPAALQEPEDLAYVIYTSGSTGEPKGVMIDHRSAVNTIVDVNERFRVTAEDRVLALSALGFDLSVYDIFGLLAAGGCIVLPDPAGLRDPEHWASLIERHRITVWNSVPALMEMLVTHESGRSVQRLGSLRLALLSGDWLPVSQPDRLRRLAPGIEVVSLGGATEASIWSILYPIGEVDPTWSSIPYGQPMRNQRFHVLDHALEPRPVWVPGDLYIGGIGLAQGYWRDTEKTTARFIEHPRTGERLYRTGDLGRYLPDGNIEFLGREDFQVKIRGHRIELGEVEAALQQIEEVRSAVVAAVGDRDGRRLVAYVVLEKPAAPEPTPEAPAPRHEAPPAPPRIEDEIAKLEFKLSEPGLRRLDAGQPAVALFTPEPDERFLAPFRQRRTYREFSPRWIAFADFSRMMAVLGNGEANGGPVRPFSCLQGGPAIETYVWVRAGRVDGVAGGTYTYDPVGHRLEPLAPVAEIPPQTYDAVNRPVLAQAAFAVFLTVQANGTMAGADLARQALLLQAGATGQALMEEGPAGGIGFCPIGNVDFASLRRGIGLDGSRLLLHSLLGGAIGAEGALGEQSDAPASAGAEVPLALPAEDDPLGAIQRARNRRDFLARPASYESFGGFLSCLRRWRLPEFPLPKYRYPSAGGLYPVQVYLEVPPGRVEGVAPGLYYYHPKEHWLALLSTEADRERHPAVAGDREAMERSACTLFLVGRLSAIAPLYGDFAHDFCVLEMGYMIQLLAASAAEHGLGLWLGTETGSHAVDGRFGLMDDGGPVQALACGPVPDLFAVLAAPEPDIAVESPFAALSAALEELSDEAPLGGLDDRVEITARLRGQLEEVLPDYMVPAQFVFLDALPLSANGKVDRKALPLPEQAGGESTAVAYAAPRSDLERRISQVWQEILGREHVGVNDNFFGIGGNSLHMVRVCARLAEDLGREVRVVELFKHPTVAALARALGEEEPREASPEVRSAAQKQREALKQARKRIKAHG